MLLYVVLEYEKRGLSRKKFIAKFITRMERGIILLPKLFSSFATLASQIRNFSCYQVALATSVLDGVLHNIKGQDAKGVVSPLSLVGHNIIN